MDKHPPAISEQVPETPVSDSIIENQSEANLPSVQIPESDQQNDIIKENNVPSSSEPIASPPIVTDPPASPSSKKTPIFSGNSQAGKKVALTFDDGPVPNYTAEYLRVLDEYQVPATFFMIGVQVDKYPHLAQKVVDMGQTIGSHSYRHGRLNLKSPEILQEDFRKSMASFNSISEIKFFRPPYGDYNNMVTETAQNFGLTSIGWNIDPRDWEVEDSNLIANHVLSHVKDGAIILLHEGKPSTLAALPKIFEGLAEMGYKIVPVAELLL